MEIEILTKKQMVAEVTKQVEAREFKMQQPIEYLQKRIISDTVENKERVRHYI